MKNTLGVNMVHVPYRGGAPMTTDLIAGVVESGHRRLVLDNFFGLSGPPKMPADVVARLHAAVNEVLASAEISKRMVDLGITTSPVSQAAFIGFVKEQVAQLAPTVKGAGIKL